MMDGPLIERDAFWGNRWHNVVVATTGAGPKAVFALDVTQTDFNGLDQAVLWELSDVNQSVKANADAIGHVLQEPEVGVLADGRWVVVIGNGYESRSEAGPAAGGGTADRAGDCTTGYGRGQRQSAQRTGRRGPGA